MSAKTLGIVQYMTVKYMVKITDLIVYVIRPVN